DVERPTRTAVISGESGQHTLQETALRVCRAKGVRLDDADCLWIFDLPQLANASDIEALRQGLKEQEGKGLILDPPYLCLLARGQASGLEPAHRSCVRPLLGSHA